MTIKELSQLYYLKKEIALDAERLARLKAAIESPKSVQIDGMPHGSSKENMMERYVAEIADLEAIITAKHEQCIHELAMLERYIAGVDDSLIRQILTLRFVEGLSWRKVAHKIGGNNTEDGVRIACFRYVAKSKR